MNETDRRETKLRSSTGTVAMEMGKSRWIWDLSEDVKDEKMKDSMWVYRWIMDFDDIHWIESTN